MDKIRVDRLYNTIPSIAGRKEWYLHGRTDHPEIRAKFFEDLRNLDGYKAHIVIARKNLDIFNQKFNSNPGEFYFDILHHLLIGKLSEYDYEHRLYLSKRGNNSMNYFQKAVDKALLQNQAVLDQRLVCKLEIVPGLEMPELSIIDYLIWAVQRKLITGESRYFEALMGKYETIIDLYT